MNKTVWNEMNESSLAVYSVKIFKYNGGIMQDLV